MRNPVKISLGILAVFAFSNEVCPLEAAAAQKTKKVIGTSSTLVEDHGKKPSVFVPLTEAECKGLGGKVLSTDLDQCAGTAKVCYTTDKDGVIHNSCITVD